MEPVIVPKCRDALDIIEQETVIGWPNGYANVDPLDYSDLNQWRDRRVWVLGGSPPSQYDVIQLLTQPTVDQQPPADIAGLDGNSVLKSAYFGESWAPDGYQRADHLSIRETVRHSLEEIKSFWTERGVWPDTEPIDRYGPAVLEPEFNIFMDKGGDPIPSREALESAYVTEYEEKGALAFASEREKKFVEYREGLTPHR